MQPAALLDQSAHKVSRARANDCARSRFAPDVGALVVLLFVHNLGSHVVRRALERVVRLVDRAARAHLLRRAKVGELGDAARVDQHVLAFDVAVDDPMLVQVAVRPEKESERESGAVGGVT